MPELTPILRDQRKVDADHLRLLSVFHFVVAGLAVFGLLLVFFHYTIIHSLATDTTLWKNRHEGGPSPVEFFSVFRWFYAFAAVLLVSGGILNLLSGFCIRQRKNRVFSMVVAALNCLQFPFGTVLSVFTFVVLLRDTVKEAYDAHP